jgi:bifunctional UDP-N-acetylglucosamine pyrophosphorylase/glucosamine-1-phosphate N-acetyltransferase
MKSDLVKVLHPLCGQPVISYVVSLAVRLRARRIIAVVGRQREKLAAALRGQPIEFVTQAEQKGTAHAVQQAERLLRAHGGTVLVLYGDVPLLRLQSLRQLLRVHRREGAACTVLTARAEDPSGYGRILRSSSGSVQGIVEDKDATHEQKRIKEINTGIYCFRGPLLFESLRKVRRNKAKREYYLTDVLQILHERGATISSHAMDNLNEGQGINTRKELAGAERVLRFRSMDELARSGITIRGPETTFIEPTVRIGADTTIHPHCHLEGRTRIGRSCSIGPFSRIISSSIPDGTHVPGFVLLDRVALRPGELLTPFTHRTGEFGRRKARA